MDRLRSVSSQQIRGEKTPLRLFLSLSLVWTTCASSLFLAGMFLSPAVAEAKDEATKGSPKRLYASTFVSGRTGYRIIHYWSDGAKMRAETLIGGHPITTIVAGDQYLVFDRLTNKGLAITRAKQAQSEESKRVRPFGNDWADLRNAGGELIEETVRLGAEAELWQLTDGVGSRKVWVTKDAPRLPLRVETFDRKSSETVSQDYSNWTLDLPMPKTFFEVGPEVEFERYEYQRFVEKSRTEPVGTVPVLYPDLLHGSRPK